MAEEVVDFSRNVVDFRRGSVDFSRKVVDFRKLFVGNAWKVVGIYSVVDSERVFVGITQ